MPTPKKATPAPLKDPGQLTKNFHLREFKCKDGTEVPVLLLPNVIELAQDLQALRDYLGEPVHINSAYRTPSYNAKVGGAKDSQHPKARAGDLTVKSKTPRELAAVIELLISRGKMRQGGIGVYPGFTHYDNRGVKARW